jgi:uncharacterized protein (TIGR02145 family)
VFTSFSLEINIHGTITDTNTTPLPGAAVKLEKYGLTTTAGADGRFALTGIVGINTNSSNLHSNALSARISNGVLFLDIMEKGLVEIKTHTLQGVAVSRLQKIMDVGTHSIAQLNKGKGVYLYRIKMGSSELVIKSLSLGISAMASVESEHRITVTANQAMRYAPIKDVIAVTKDGYLNYRVIVTNSDTSGIEIKMIICADTVRDIDGNLYQAVRIGNQVWTTENLRTTRYNNGTPIGNYCYYANMTNADSIKRYGALYVGSAMMDSKIAPSGWHVPKKQEWDTLQGYLINNGYNWDGTVVGNKIAKSLAANADWGSWGGSDGTISKDLVKNNRTGFSGFPGGQRDYDGNYSLLGMEGFFWAQYKANTFFIELSCDLVYLNIIESVNDLNFKCYRSIRLVRN